MKNKLILILILIISFGFRIYRVGQYPPLLWDEASLGYNAYSILKTGKDEYGNTLPLIFKSFGDYKPGFYVYLSIPFIGALGLNQLAVRLPSVILGSLTPLVLYLLVKEVSKDERLSLISAGVLAVLPWHIHFSRGAWEVNVMTFLVTLGTYGVIKWLADERVKWLITGLSSFLFGLVTYQGAKMVVPLIGLGLGYLLLRTRNFEHRELKRYIVPKFVIPGFIFVMLTAWWYLASFSGPASNRLKVASLFSYRRPSQEIREILSEDRIESKNFHYIIFHGEWLHFLRGGMSRYFNHFSPRFLGFEGDWQNARHSAPYFGVIGHFGLILLILGLIFFVSKNKNWRNGFWIYWLIALPLPAVLTRDSVSSVRSLPMIIAISFFIAYGISNIMDIFKNNARLFITCYLLLIIFFVSDFGYYLDLYYNHMVKLNPKQWLYGHNQAVNYIADNQNQFDRIKMTNFYGQPYIFYLFFTKYPPSQFQSQVVFEQSNQVDVGSVKKIDKISFEPINWSKDSVDNDLLVILSEDEVFRNELEGKPIFDQFRPLGKIKGTTMFYGYEGGER
jgi:4-amino-4-deoxy-L-arabinose transferase-like glycosyltransferase